MPLRLPPPGATLPQSTSWKKRIYLNISLSTSVIGRDFLGNEYKFCFEAKYDCWIVCCPRPRFPRVGRWASVEAGLRTGAQGHRAQVLLRGALAWNKRPPPRGHLCSGIAGRAFGLGCSLLLLWVLEPQSEETNVTSGLLRR